jgi:hypothetical protein
VLGLFELLDERNCLVSGELAAGLALREAHRTPCVTEVGVTGILEERQQLPYLPSRCRGTRWLTECHPDSLADAADEDDASP